MTCPRAHYIIRQHPITDIVVYGVVERHAAAYSTAVTGDPSCDVADDSARCTVRLLEKGTNMAGKAETNKALAGDFLPVVVGPVRVDALDDVGRQPLSHWQFAADEFATKATLAVDLLAGDEVGEGKDDGEGDEGERRKIHGSESCGLMDVESLVDAGELVVCCLVFSSGQVNLLYQEVAYNQPYYIDRFYWPFCVVVKMRFAVVSNFDDHNGTSSVVKIIRVDKTCRTERGQRDLLV
ncbi:hypothetical protein MMC07_002071 [Pseudocyphellaria aurata]|nr:hypothetical protein [Pseudocyphellaria aurata]